MAIFSQTHLATLISSQITKWPIEAMPVFPSENIFLSYSNRNGNDEALICLHVLICPFPMQGKLRAKWPEARGNIKIRYFQYLCLVCANVRRRSTKGFSFVSEAEKSEKRPHFIYCFMCHTTLDRCYDFKNIFAEKLGEKIAVFWLITKLHCEKK
jgi:hypothetical protein